MSRIEAKLSELREAGQAALIPFVTAGDPDLETTLRILRALDENGADCIELGVPFSDPTADGPTIQRSSERALKKRLSLPRILALVRRFRRTSSTPLILFGYFNPFFRFGLERLCRRAKAAGVDGILCVDLPPEESGELKRWADAAGLDLIFLLSPTSGPDRVRLVSREGRGFIYYVSVTGVTGARRAFDKQLPEQVARVRRATSLPVGVGFGISTPEQAAWIAEFADAAVVGSALVEVIERAGGSGEKARAAGAFVGRLKRAMKRVVRNGSRRAERVQ
ncbi:MAG TPA: tryptophan synthase subunit alpha [candidate division Zixibacteria bacterium]|nr:tryptophan synthase subunit alpha [candidate division Zixibacteria bacterium]